MADRPIGRDPDFDPVLRDVVRAVREPADGSDDLVERIMADVRLEPLPRRVEVAGESGVMRTWGWGMLAAALGTLVVGGTLLWGSRPAGERAGDNRPIQFVFVAPDAQRVALVGNFNDWDAGATPLARSAAAGVWSVELSLPPGRHEYAFVVDDGEWHVDASAPRATADEFGAPSSIVLVNGGDDQ